MNVGFRAIESKDDWDWFNTHVEIVWVADTTGIFAFDTDTGERLAACIMDSWTKNSVQCHLAVPRPIVIKHGFLHECFNYVFNTTERKYVYGMVPSTCSKALKLNKNLGFTELLRLPEAVDDGVDYVVMELKRKNCRFIAQPEHREVA